MKKAIAILTCLAGIFPPSIFAFGTVNLQGSEFRIDTLAHVKTGPGTTYTSVTYTGIGSGRKMTGFFLTMKLDQQKNVDFKVELGKDSTLNVERPSEIAKRKSSPGKQYFAAINADFYIVASNIQSLMGTPNECCILNGEIGCGGFDNIDRRGHFFVDSDKQIYCDIPTHSFRATTPDGSTLTFSDVNINRPGNDNSLILFNERYGGYTKNDNRTEVTVQLCEGEQWGINKDISATVIKEASKGNKVIGPRCAVISASGSEVKKITSLKTGDTIKFRFGMQLQDHGTSPDITECAGGDVVILRNGITTMEADRWINPRDANNPRTMVGYSEDKKTMVWALIDGRSQISTGCTYPEGSDIMRAAGCHDAVNFDGGGSSAMYLQNIGIVNRPSDGNERAVANGLFAVLNAPEDNEIAEIQFADYISTMPQHGIFTPRFYGYNKYGLLIDTDVKGVTLECSQDLGSITDDGATLYATGTGCHPLTATFGDNIKAQIPVTVQQSEAITTRLQNILNDGARTYTIELQTSINDKTMAVSPAAFEWSSENPEIATVGENSGIINGIADGATTINGISGNSTLSLNVKVQRPDKHRRPIDTDYNSLWAIKQTGGKNTVLKTLADGFSIEYDGSSSRNPNIRMSKDFDLWSLPDSIRIKINPGEAPVKTIRITLKDATGSQHQITFNDIPKNAESVHSTAIDQILDAGDMIFYPLQFSNINIITEASVTGKHYTINVPEFQTVYNAIPSGIENITAPHTSFRPVPNPVESNGTITIDAPLSSLTATFYSIDGKPEAYVKAYESGNGYKIPVNGLAPGKHILQVQINQKHVSEIIIVI